LGLDRVVLLERLHHQRKPRHVGEQPEGDLVALDAVPREPRLPEPIILVGLEGHVDTSDSTSDAGP
jgi:hypothetical protein